MSRAVLSLGANIGDRVAYLRGAVGKLAGWTVAVSPIFRTAPWGPVAQQDYLNAVLIVADEAAEPADWLSRAQECERAAGRIRSQRWGPRTLDVDVVTVDSLISADPVLTLPHPRAAERAFVLVPWWAVDPEAILPGRGSVLELLQLLPKAEVDGVHLMAGLELRP